MSGGLHLDAFTELLEGAQGARQIVEVGLDELTTSPVQVRAPFDPQNNEDDAGLVESVRQDGVIQPLLVVLRAEGGAYQIIDGHRRAAAARATDLSTAPCIVLTLDQVEAAFQTGISNLQRRDLTPLEEGRQYVELMRISDLSARELATRLGKPARTVQQRVSLTELPSRVQDLLDQGQLTVHQAEGCRHEAWGPALAELAAGQDLVRDQIDKTMEYLEAHPGATPQEAIEALMSEREPTDRADRADRETSPPARPAAKKTPRVVDYRALVAGLDVALSDERRDVLAQYAELEQLDPHAVRWAALILAGSQTMTAAAAVAYANQIASMPVGRALRAIDNGLQTLERRVERPRQLTPNTGVAAREVIRDLTARLGQVSTELVQAVGLNCAGARTYHQEDET